MFKKAMLATLRDMRRLLAPIAAAKKLRDI
jgi:hypothetical protein